ncbi:Predicted arabinose efflux permease, MFS family [Nonomuraea solani]|uniref:Predicted arabinose efflux permease, MFS family n=1 Tax=Nonomuraea solani TaxID=1144553 RepID=A0A1H6CYJ5_9ACTN|nr:MFS transporter [Nonomuraea solani]SEG78121.1 Predicted arabinose efflux permease, MFS family [Nonomuraea solani]
MSTYLSLLKSRRDFRHLWLGSSISVMGDSMTFIALSWLVLAQPDGTARLGLLAICYTAPVLIGGLAAGPLLDRFDKRTALIADSVLRGLAVASIPFAAVVATVPTWLPFLVAALYGLLKMIPMAAVPAAIPDLVTPGERDAANALESVSYSLSGIIGFTAAAPLLHALGPEAILALDAATYACFAITVRLIRKPMRHRPHPSTPPKSPTPVFRDKILIGTTLAFMAFNIAEGAMTMVVAPWLAKEHLPGNGATLSLLMAALSAGELLGGFAAGAWRPRIGRLTAIALVELVAAAGFLAVLATPEVLPVAAGFLIIGTFSAPMTVWAQSLRMERIPPSQRGRVFSVFRTMMQATPPIGAALITPLLVTGDLTGAVILMTTLAALPALLLLLLRETPEPAIHQTPEGAQHDR